MKKSFVKALMLSAMVAVAGTPAAFAQEKPQGQQTLVSMGSVSDKGKPIPVDPPKSGETNSAPAPRAPAPPLTAMWVYAVGSTNCGWEYTAGLTTTTCDHGGPELRTAVLEIGYGASRVAWMNSGLVPSGSMYASTPVCVTGGYYTWPCTAGQTVVGFLNEYNLDGNQSGLFKYQNTSSNSPFNTMSVQINIL